MITALTEDNLSRRCNMYRELETPADQIRAEKQDSSTPCDCVCGEPAPSDADEAPAGNKTAVILEVHWDING